MKHRSKQNVKKLKIHWISIWFAIALLSVISFTAYAVYTQVYSVKRVVSTKSTPQTYFSSNCMRKDGSRKQLSTNVYTVTVCNYDQDFPDVYNPNVVNYVFKATLQLKIGDEYVSYSELSTKFEGDTLTTYQKKFTDVADQYKVQWTADDGNTITDDTEHALIADSFSYTYTAQSLKAGVSATDKFKITIPEDDLRKNNPEFFVYVEASPVNDSINPTIFSRLYGAQIVETEATWKGTLAESDTATVDYDFYNYILTGSGSGTLDIMWDPTYFEINDFFTNNAISGATFEGGTTPQDVTSGDHAGNNWVKLTLQVDSEKTRYDVQFYKVKENTAYTGEYAASKFIDYEFHAAQ